MRVTAISTATSDADRADGAHQTEERDAGDVEREQRDDHGGAGEDDRVAGCAVGEADRLAHLGALEQLLAVPVDDEEGVVDADREAEHDAQHRGHRGHLHDAGEREVRERADARRRRGR